MVRSPAGGGAHDVAGASPAPVQIARDAVGLRRRPHPQTTLSKASMKLQIYRIHSRGDSETECVVLGVIDDCNVQDYVLMDSSKHLNSLYLNTDRHNYWFPNVELKRGDVVFLWTCKGTNTAETKDGVTCLHLYWGKSGTVWHNEGDVALLFHVADLQRHPVAVAG